MNNDFDNTKANELAKKKEHLAIILDKSGSMSSSFSSRHIKSRIHCAWEAAIAIVSSTDDVITELSVIAFDTKIFKVCEKMDSISILTVLNLFEADGGTALGAAINAGISIDANRLIILTDGYPDSEAATIAAATEAAARSIKIDTIGIGESNDILLKEISKMTNGIFKHPNSPEELIQHFVQLETKNRLMITYLADPLSPWKEKSNA